MALTKTALRDQIKTLIVERIAAGVYKPGERLVETRIARELGVSQTPVREAFRQLEALRLIDTSLNRSATVRVADEDELEEIFPVRAALEQLAARLAADRMTPRVLRRLETEINAMRRSGAAGNIRMHVRHSVAFHQLVVESSGNRLLTQVWASLGLTDWTHLSVLMGGVDLVSNADSHLPILDALSRNDSEAAGDLIRAHDELYAETVRKARELRTLAADSTNAR